MLREFRIIKLRSHPVWIVIHPDAPNRNGPSGMRIVGDAIVMLAIEVRCLANSGVGRRRGARGKGKGRMKLPGEGEKYKAQSGESQ